MPKKPTKANIKAAAELTITHEGGVEKAITHYKQARRLAEKSADQGSVDTFDRLIEYCQNR